MKDTTYQNQPSQLSDNVRNIIINVDDLGLSNAVNDAVLNLAELGRISASSYMIGGSITDSDIKQLDKLKIDIGLHFDLTGVFQSELRGSLKSIIASSYLRRLNPSKVTDVVKQQLDCYEDRFGRAPIFIDGHQHIHQLPVIRYCLADELKKRYASNDLSTSISARNTTPLVNDVKSWVIYMLGGLAWRKLCEQNQLATNDLFAGVYNFNVNSRELAALWEKWLNKASSHLNLTTTAKADTTPTTLIMCHPAIPDDSWQDEIKAAREIEYQWMMSEGFASLLEESKVNLIGWSEKSKDGL